MPAGDMDPEGLQRTLAELLAANRKTQDNLDEIRNQFPIQPGNVSDLIPDWSELEEGGLEPPKEGEEFGEQLAFPTGIGVIEHGSEGATERSSQYGHYIWVGEAEPANAESYDFWVKIIEPDTETLAEEINALETDDTLVGVEKEETLEGREGWEKPEWADNIGVMHNAGGDSGWFSTEDEKVAAAVWNKEKLEVKDNTIVVDATFLTSGAKISPVKDTEQALWLLNDVNGKSGYRLVKKYLTAVNAYDFNFRLERWDSGSVTVLAESPTFTSGTGGGEGELLDEGHYILAVDDAGVAAYRCNLSYSEITRILSATDTTYSSGYGGIESELADFGGIAGHNAEGFRVGTVAASATSTVTLSFRLIGSWFKL